MYHFRDMNNRSRKLPLGIVFIVMTTVAGVLWLPREIRQFSLDRQLAAALSKDDTKLARDLVETGADPNTPCNPPTAHSLRWFRNWILHRQASAPSAFLTACGIGYGWDSGSILRLRQHPDDPELIRVMLAHGANLNDETDYHQSALLGAVTNYHVRVAEVLLKHGIKIDAPDKAGQTPLMWAAMDNEPDMVHLLLASGANVRLQDQDGDTALYYAVWSGANADIVRQLLAYKADPNVRNKLGETALSWGSNTRETVALLRNAGR